MIEQNQPTISELWADHQLITNAINRGVRQAVLASARAGHCTSTLQDGKVVWLPPEEIIARLTSENAS